MAKIFVIRIEDTDFDEIREQYGKGVLQETDDEQVIKDFMAGNGIKHPKAWQIK